MKVFTTIDKNIERVKLKHKSQHDGHRLADSRLQICASCCWGEPYSSPVVWVWLV